ncbi:tetratricopeptide repeat protein [Pendulispora brunnea]|uniref:Tetratricopeptide repeat protein n=1 Tax=Pendulispora brunnea TaxID=2905690 RepID=A0ABZ2K2F2_9BACT
MHRKHAIFVATLAATMFCASAASAQTGESQAAGRALFDEGIRLFERGRYEEACPKFEASLARYAGIGTRGKLAECYEKIGRTASAWALYREVAALAGRAGDSDRQALAEERSKALEPKLARITVTVAAGGSVPGLVVKRNGVALVAGELGSAIAVDPGEVVIEASAPQRKAWSQRVPIQAARAARVEVPVLGPEEAAAPAIGQHPIEKDTGSPSSHYGWQRPAGLVVGGVGVATMLVGGYFGLSAKSTYDDALNGNCNDGTKTCNEAGLEDTDRAKDKALVSTILVGAGAAMTITGAVLFFTAPKRTSATALRVAPDTGVGRVGVVLSGRF